MQIHEITTLSENFLKRLATDARNDAFKNATGVDWKTYKLAQTAGQSDTPVAATTPAAVAQPAATTQSSTPNFTQTNKTQYQPATVNAPVAKVPATPKPTVATAPQSPEQIRKAKQAQAAPV